MTPASSESEWTTFGVSNTTGTPALAAPSVIFARQSV
eukprot:CAMPEP_0198211650 /NCGR_PEP_ID=MMETSP1445-20131203/24976_1 /TAXON_ID=36898 /ORGANISM="Pyramimonas sp., Strain CCMP2087" /LENGTH=36 /DNA_ID= /DNA_START= /DNA_END= /DNA_ORIENTATION=